MNIITPRPMPYNLVAVIAFVCALFIPPAGFVLGIVANRTIDPDREQGAPLADAAIAVGLFLTLFVVAMILTVAT